MKLIHYTPPIMVVQPFIKPSIYFMQKAIECLGFARFFTMKSALLLDTDYNIRWSQGYIPQYLFRCIYFGTASTWYSNAFDHVLQAVYWGKKLYTSVVDRDGNPYDEGWDTKKTLSLCTYEFVVGELKNRNETKARKLLTSCSAKIEEVRKWANYIKHKLVEETGLTRKAVVAILTGIEKVTFNQFKDNPEEFIIRAAALINDEKATAIIQHITYNVLDERYTTDIFTEPTIKGKLDVNARKATRSLFDHIVYDSTNERDFSSELDANSDIAVYVKLPDSFYISTPVGHYNPDWAIAFYEGTVKHIYFVAETKGSMRSMQLRLIEESKIHCAREHFKAISDNNVVYDVVDSYQTLLEKVMR